MRVLVTGGAGFIGSHLVEALLAAGHRVLAIDDLSTGSIQNVELFRGMDGFRFVSADLRVPEAALRAADDGQRPEVVFHLAAAVGVRTILDLPLSSLETNLHGTKNVLAAAVEWGAKVIIASTSEVYGKNDVGALTEESDRILGPGDLARWWYAVAKMADEALALAHHREARLQALVVRLFNTVGPRQTGRYGMVLPTLVRQALAGETLTVYGDGTQTRCFTYVHDTVRALMALAETPEAYGRIFNIGQSAEISINDLAQRVLKLTGSCSDVVHVPYEEAYGGSFEDMRRRVPDCSLLQRTVGFAPTDRLDEAILAVAEEYRARGLEEPCAPR